MSEGNLARNPYYQEAARLREVNEALTRRFDALLRALAPVVTFPAEWGLTAAERRALSAFCKSPSGFVSCRALHLLAPRGAESVEKVVQVRISMVRKKTGLKIKWRHGGYIIEPGELASLRSLARGVHQIEPPALKAARAR